MPAATRLAFTNGRWLQPRAPRPQARTPQTREVAVPPPAHDGVWWGGGKSRTVIARTRGVSARRPWGKKGGEQLFSCTFKTARREREPLLWHIVRCGYTQLPSAPFPGVSRFLPTLVGGTVGGGETGRQGSAHTGGARLLAAVPRRRAHRRQQRLSSSSTRSWRVA